MYSFPNFESVHCFMSGSNCCFLTCIQVSQKAGKVVWYSHLLKNFPQLVVIHTVKGFVDHSKLWKILKQMGILDHLTCLFRNLYVSEEATVRTGHETTDWFQIKKGVCQGCILSPCLFNLYAEYIMRNAGLEEAQAGIKIDGRNISNLRYADDTTLMKVKK